jgi:hypothetical protein
MKRFLATGAILWLAGTAPGPSAAATNAAAPSVAAQASPEAARSGAFCTPTSCRPRAASPLTGAAFGAVVVAIGWRARRRSPDPV